MFFLGKSRPFKARWLTEAPFKLSMDAKTYNLKTGGRGRSIPWYIQKPIPPLLRIYENLTGSFTPSTPLPGFNRGLT
jgi:hypothetical protein